MDRGTASCRICGNDKANRLHYPREMMYGWGDIFEYVECGDCGCVQIVEVPQDIGRYYVDGYYSYKPPKEKRYPQAVLGLRELRTRHLLGERQPIGALLALLSRRHSEHFDWFRRGKVRLDSAIVDIGCGAGKLLRQLQRDGFKNLLGVDPFIADDIDYGGGLRILKRRIQELDRRFDFIMLHHSFEHMPDPRETLQHLRRAIADDGTLLLRIPVADSYARRKYGICWMAWDAPRHLFLHTVRSVHVLARQTGFRVLETTYDSAAAQLASSELYLRDIPFTEHPRFQPGKGPDAYSAEEWRHFAHLAEALNARRDGDTACFYLQPAR
jgi:SAM-dependent methyltransferase